MSKLIIALGVLVLLMGVSIGLAPDWFLGVTDWESQQGLYIAASMRIVSGSILLLAGSASRYPQGLRIVGALVLLAGLILLFLPLGLWVGLIDWLMAGHPTFFRVGGGVGGTLVGLFLVYAGSPKSSDP